MALKMWDVKTGTVVVAPLQVEPGINCKMGLGWVWVLRGNYGVFPRMRGTFWESPFRVYNTTLSLNSTGSFSHLNIL